MIWRGIAGFLGGFTLANLLGEMFFRGFDANIWWIDLRALPPAFRALILLLGAIALLVFSLRPILIARARLPFCLSAGVLAFAAMVNAITFYVLLISHRISSTVPVPLSLLIASALVIVIRKMSVARRRPANENLDIWKAFAAFAVCLIAFPLAQVFFFGHTDYRRPADAVVVFGARAYANGTRSILSCGLRRNCFLYRIHRLQLALCVSKTS